MKLQTENIFQVIELDATPSQVFDIFLNTAQHAAFTGLKANIDAREGGEFTVCDGRATGRILKLVQNKKIVFAWNHKKFPANFYSVVDILLEKTEEGTSIHFNHLGVPVSCDGWMTETWQQTYWEPLKAYLEAGVPA
jgi:activator of HSP90 ATPase